MRTITVLGLIVISGGCTVATHDTAETPASSETTEKTTTTSSSIANPLTDDSAATASTTETNLFGGDDPEDFLMPDVLCMNLQAAQDEIQDHGVFFSHSEDATGQGRRQLLDSGWIVVRQSPAPGNACALT